MDSQAVRDALATVEDPTLGADLVSLGLVKEISVAAAEAEAGADGGRITVRLALGAPHAPAETTLRERVRAALTERFPDAAIDLTAAVPTDHEPAEDPLPGVTNVIAVASGKGGVGKSTVAVNLATGMADRGARVGLFDADIYGPNVPRMLGAETPPETDAGRLVPPERFGVALMSMAFLVGEDDPVIWRGPMVHNLITQLWDDVQWGQLDYLVVDLPPGTGDTQLTLLQSVPLVGAVVVTTPQAVAVDDARKGLRMFGKHDTPVLGIVENMSGFRCPECGSEHALFGDGGGRAFAEETEMPFLGEIPLDPAIRRGGDDGRPAVLGDDEVAAAFRTVVERTMDNVGYLRRQAARSGTR